MGKTFDYAAAWRHLARPAYESLPANVRALLARVAVEAAELHQLPDLSMPWPQDSDLRATFDKVPAEWLALAARAVYFVGHWHPGPRYLVGAAPLELPGREHGATWKFAHYADQVLRGRLGLAESGDRYSGGGFGLQVIEGAIRLSWSSRDSWTWEEIAPATRAGMDHAEAQRAAAGRAVAAFPESARAERDNAAHKAITDAATFWPDVWWAKFADTAAYMVEEGDQEPPPPDPEGDAQRAAVARQRMIDTTAKKIRDLETERDGRLWFFDRGIPTDNLIFYNHTGVFTFGWRSPVGPALVARILDVISEFPHPYAIKTHDGRTLEGGIE